MYYQKFFALLQAVVAKWGKDEEVFELVGNALKSFGSYVMSIYAMETRIMLLRARCQDAVEFQAEVAQLDWGQALAYGAVTAHCSSLNRLAKRLGLDNLCPDTDDRQVISDFCADITMELFRRGQEDRLPISDQEVQEFLDNAAE